MKPRHLAPLLAASFLLACQPNVFPVEVKGETTIQGDPSPLPALLEVFPSVGSFSNIDFDQSQEFQNQGVTKEQVKSIKPDRIRLKIVSPETQDFSFLQNLQFFARANDQEVLIADRFDIDKLGLKAPNPTLELDVKDAELQPYITAPSMSIIVRGKGKLPPQDTRLEATVGMRVEIQVF